MVTGHGDDVIAGIAMGFVVGAHIDDIIVVTAVQRVDAARPAIQRVVAPQGIDDVVLDPPGVGFGKIATVDDSHGMYPLK